MRTFRERLKGFEPSTLCMASRTLPERTPRRTACKYYVSGPATGSKESLGIHADYREFLDPICTRSAARARGHAGLGRPSRSRLVAGDGVVVVAVNREDAVPLDQGSDLVRARPVADQIAAAVDGVDTRPIDRLEHRLGRRQVGRGPRSRLHYAEAGDGPLLVGSRSAR
jgi:hypothetical protein